MLRISWGKFVFVMFRFVGKFGLLCTGFVVKTLRWFKNKLVFDKFLPGLITSFFHDAGSPLPSFIFLFLPVIHTPNNKQLSSFILVTNSRRPV